MVFHRSLNYNKSPPVSRTLLGILADFNNAIVWIVSTCLFISNPPVLYQSFGDCTKSTNYNSCNGHFQGTQFLKNFPRFTYKYFFSLSFNFIQWSAGTAASMILQVLFFFFFLIIIRSGRLVEIRLSISLPYYYYYYLHPSFLTGVWVTTNLLKSPGLFSVFYPLLTMQKFGWSPPVFIFPRPPVLVPVIWWLYQVHQLQLD